MFVPSTFTNPSISSRVCFFIGTWRMDTFQLLTSTNHCGCNFQCYFILAYWYNKLPAKNWKRITFCWDIHLTYSNLHLHLHLTKRKSCCKTLESRKILNKIFCFEPSWLLLGRYIFLMKKKDLNEGGKVFLCEVEWWERTELLFVWKQSE